MAQSIKAIVIAANASAMPKLDSLAGTLSLRKTRIMTFLLNRETEANRERTIQARMARLVETPLRSQL
jgi:hypothetical protein